LLVGLISDTHGLVRPSVHTALKGVDLILHAGDVGGDEVLAELGLIAPVRAIRGNTDPVDDPSLPPSLELELDGVRVHVSHGHEIGYPTPEGLASAYEADLVVFGHTHRQRIDRFGERWIVNPGAAGARRYDLPPSIALARLDSGSIGVTIVTLEE
jgi:putative phosphoesterase